MDLLHGAAGILHGVERLLVDVGRLYVVDFSFQRHDLALGLLESVFKLLFSPKSSFGGCFPKVGINIVGAGAIRGNSRITYLSCCCSRTSWPIHPALPFDFEDASRAWKAFPTALEAEESPSSAPHRGGLDCHPQTTRTWWAGSNATTIPPLERTGRGNSLGLRLGAGFGWLRACFERCLLSVVSRKWGLFDDTRTIVQLGREDEYDKDEGPRAAWQ
jgi:hypothetical protein